MSKKKQQSVSHITHVIQSRITEDSEKHVCGYCGKDTSLMEVSYEVVTQDQADQVAEEVRYQSSIDNAVRIAQQSSVGDAIYEATLREQQDGPPQEHHRYYRCFYCMALLISKATGIPHSGEVLLLRLVAGSSIGAVFAARNVNNPDRIIMMNAPFQDPISALQALRHNDLTTQ